MAPTLIILDTEFTNFTNPALISIGLISVDGTSMFYRELTDYSPVGESDFVKQVVLPLLDPIAHGTPSTQVAADLYEWLSQFTGGVVLLVDYAADYHLFRHLMQHTKLDVANIAVEWITPTMYNAAPRAPTDRATFAGRVSSLQQEYYTLFDDRRHHALVDVQAYQYAWASLTQTQQ